MCHVSCASTSTSNVNNRIGQITDIFEVHHFNTVECDGAKEMKHMAVDEMQNFEQMSAPFATPPSFVHFVFIFFFFFIVQNYFFIRNPIFH